MVALTQVAPIREGYNSYLVGGQPFNVPDHYVVTKAIGQGAYGIVWYGVSILAYTVQLFFRVLKRISRIMWQYRGGAECVDVGGG